MGLCDGVLRPSEVDEVSEPHEAEIADVACYYEAHDVQPGNILHTQQERAIGDDHDSGKGGNRARPKVCCVAFASTEDSRVLESPES